MKVYKVTLMRKTRIGKVISIFLFLVFTLQVTDLTCVEEAFSFNTPETQGEYQLTKADLDSGSSGFLNTNILECHCPCHLSFLYPSSIETIFCQEIGLHVTLTDDLSPKIPMDIFQPPKALI